MRPEKNKIILFFFVLSFIIILSGRALNSNLKINDENADKSIVEGLLSLPYMSSVNDDTNPGKIGVTLYNTNRSYPGFNILVSRHMRGAHLLDMKGNILHKWLPKQKISDDWLHAEVDEEGNLFVLINHLGLVKMDWDSSIKWISNSSENKYLNLNSKYPTFQGEIMNGYHHDFDIGEDEEIYVLAGEERIINQESARIPILDNSIIILDPEGVPRKKLSFYDLMGERIPEDWLDNIAKKIKKRETLHFLNDLDVFHANTVEVIPRDLGIASKGDLLICIRNLNLIGIIDITKEELVWSWGSGILDKPHHPTVLENGNILVFDNGVSRDYSRVLEINPITEEIVWAYEADPKESFFTLTRGSNQRLPNGNTLITESNKGHVFEVTNAGEIVWDFWNPDFNNKGERMIIYKMLRIEEDYLSAKLNHSFL